ncbi:M35 family metallo-endopeptidase [Ideonella sp. A 288]|uniref:M35 family metallo-endopeptidase n=1 Tax=Ideonella sp. A 288 TaxID=1962181 RepID=UPI000B4BC623|nr:M35 family metallo-endopeptidase [Ideonella sp. A 288]
MHSHFSTVARCGRAGIVLAALVGLCAPGAARAALSIPAHMPATPMPDIKGCSQAQEVFLRAAWRRAHYFTWRAHTVLAHIRSRPAAERAALWHRDHGESSRSPAVSRWFGPYDAQRAAFVGKALDKANQRFLMRGDVVKGIRTLRCGSPLAPAQDEHTDVCPDKNPGSDGPPAAYHAPVGTIVMCPVSWEKAHDPTNDEHLDAGARRLVHELFHWLSVDGRYIVDRHADGVGGQADGKYYGIDAATELASNKPEWAARNNDNYAYFARAAGLAAPTYSGLFTAKEAGGTGAFFAGMDWDGLVGQWQALRGQQYLADVETYVVGGQRRFIGLWRIGTGQGALLSTGWAPFSKTFEDLAPRQDLIDVETFDTPQGRQYLGVWRDTSPDRMGQGGLLVGLSWSDLVDKWKALAAHAHLVDVESWAEGSSRRWLGVWRPGGGPSALFQADDWSVFAEQVERLKDQQQLIDYDRHQDSKGKPHYTGVWRGPGATGPLHRGMTLDELIDRRRQLTATHTLIDVEVSVPLAFELR